MLKQIAQTRNSFDVIVKRDDRIEKINELIEVYNRYNMNREDITVDGLIALQKIMHITNQLINEYQKNPEKLNNEFMVWYLQNPVHHELVLLKNEEWPLTEDNFVLLQLFTEQRPSIEIMSKDEWLHRIKSKHKISFFRSSSSSTPNMKEFNEVTLWVTLLNDYYCTGYKERNPEALLTVAKQLQKELLDLELPANVEVVKEIKELLVKTNTFLAHLHINVIKDAEKESSDSIIPSDLIHFHSWEQSDRLRELIVNLINKQESFILTSSSGEFTAKFIGGGNNFNWLIRNEIDDVFFVIQIEKAGYGYQLESDYLLVHRIRNDPDLLPFLAISEQYYPTDPVELTEGVSPELNRYSNPRYNIRITEYCPRGDLMNDNSRAFGSWDRNNPENWPPIMNSVLDKTYQVAFFVDFLLKKNLAYTDIKAENFLIREDGNVITADIKSIMYVFAHNLRYKDIKITNFYVPIEWFSPKKSAQGDLSIKAEPFMVYQLGLMFFVLLTGLQGDNLAEVLESRLLEPGIDFNKYPIFMGCPDELKQLIRLSLNTDPDSRPALQQFIKVCRAIHPELEIDKIEFEEGDDIREELDRFKNEFIFHISDLIADYTKQAQNQVLGPLRNVQKKISLLEDYFNAVKIDILEDQFEDAFIKLHKLKLDLNLQFGEYKVSGAKSNAYKLVENIENMLHDYRTTYIELLNQNSIADPSSSSSSSSSKMSH